MKLCLVLHHVNGKGAASSLQDRRCAIDVVILREALKASGGSLRWCPTDRQLADGLTKDKGDPADLLRACMRTAQYQLADESTVLDNKAPKEPKECRGPRREPLPKNIEIWTGVPKDSLKLTLISWRPCGR